METLVTAENKTAAAWKDILPFHSCVIIQGEILPSFSVCSQELF